MVNVGLYIYVNEVITGVTQSVVKRIELFKDETISVNSSIQNANDIGKTYTDFTQSFTIPASTHNNGIFRHWYESSVDDGFDHRTRYDAFIELDTIFFRSGKIQIEKASRKNGYIESYSITFYGNLVQLKDRFGEDMLSSLDFSTLNHPWTSNEVYNRITTTASYDVRYPIIGGSFSYEYKTGVAPNDVTVTPIKWYSLPPAVRIESIIELIGAKYGLFFTGSFLTDERLTKLWMLFKNVKTIATEPYCCEPISIPGPGSSGEYITYCWTSCYDNLDYCITVDGFDTGTADALLPCSSGSTASMNIGSFSPEITVADFFMGIVKMFNLIINPINATTFELLPLEDYYTSGKYNDITKYVFYDDGDIVKPKLYNKIEFKYQDSKSILNDNFNQSNSAIRGYNYGDLNYIDAKSNEKQTYSIQLPFENVMWMRSTAGTSSTLYNFMTTPMIDKDLKPYIPKPLVFYEVGLETVGSGSTNTIKMTGQSGQYDMTKYFRFSNETYIGGTSSANLYSINWGAENSSWSFTTTVTKSLFDVYYSPYITNLYSIKMRTMNVKAHIPPTALTDIRLNDRIIIRDKRYTINTMTTDLTTGVVTFDLFLDLRAI